MEAVSLLSHQSHHVPGIATSIEFVTESALKGEVTGTGTQSSAGDKQGQSSDGPLYHSTHAFREIQEATKGELSGSNA